jgi:hypothetical protein
MAGTLPVRACPTGSLLPGTAPVSRRFRADFHVFANIPFGVLREKGNFNKIGKILFGVNSHLEFEGQPTLLVSQIRAVVWRRWTLDVGFGRVGCCLREGRF